MEFGTKTRSGFDRKLAGIRARIRPGEFPMLFVDINSLRVIERLPGWHGRYFHSPSMTFAHYDFVRGSSIHEHFHPQEEVYEVIEGALGTVRQVL